MDAENTMAERKFDPEQLKRDGGRCVLEDGTEVYAHQLPSGMIVVEHPKREPFSRWFCEENGIGGGKRLFNVPRKVKVYVWEHHSGKRHVSFNPDEFDNYPEWRLWGTAEVTEGEGLTEQIVNEKDG